MNIEKKELDSTANTDELHEAMDEISKLFGEDNDNTATSNASPSLPDTYPPQIYTNTGSSVGQLPAKYQDPNYLKALTYDEMLRGLTEAYIDLAELAGLSDARVISDGLLKATNKAIGILNMSIIKSSGNCKTKGIRVLQYLLPAQIGECLIRLHNVVNLSLDDSDEISEKTTVLAIYVDIGKDEGLYHQDSSDTVLKRMINQYSFCAKKNDQSEVLNYLHVHAPLKKSNSNRDLIACNNGIFDYKNKVLLPFSPEYVFKTKLKVGYNPDAQNVVIHNVDDDTDWDAESWISDIADDAEIADLLWQLISASVRPNVHYNKAVFLYSTEGNNGKGTLLQLIRNLWGTENCSPLSIEDFEAEFLLEDLLDTSIVLGDENRVGYTLDKAERFKRCVTQDPMLVNGKHIRAKKFKFKGLIIECVNDIPRFKDNTGSLARRMLIIPFSKSYTGMERKYIKDDYIARTEVLEYVLYKALNMDFYEFSEPQACKDALVDQREINDPIRQFWIEVSPQFVWDLLPTDFLFELYKAWTTKNIPNCHQKQKKDFIRELADIVKNEKEWQYTGGRNQVRVSNRIDKPEPLIAAYGIEDWKNPNYTGSDINRICIPKLKDKYTGLIRR